jgi:AraC-like DNA-binding protein
MENVSPVYARLLLRDALRLGITAEQLLAGTSLTRPALETGGDISMEDFLAVLENSRLLTGNEMLGLTVIGRNSSMITLGPMGIAAATSPNLRSGLQVVESFTRLHISYMQVELAFTPRGLSVRFRYLSEPGKVQRFHTESGMMLIQHYVETITGEPLRDTEFRMALPAPEYAADYPEWLHGSVSFDWPQSSVELPADMLDPPSPFYDADLWQQATRNLAQQIKSLEGREQNPYTRHVEAFLRSCDTPVPGVAGVLDRLHLSERTLNRRLQQEGTSFREIRGNILAARARQYLLETDDSVESIAAALGYQDAANFRRAFRRAEGCSPAQFRRRGL